MSNHAAPLALGTALAGGTHRLLSRMEREYTELDTLTRPTTAAMYALYGPHVASLAWAAGRRVWPVSLPNPAARITGGTLTLSGAALALAGAHRFGSASQLSGLERGSLHATGLYRYSRNPQYLGLVLAAAGVALAARSAFAGALAGGIWATYRRWIPSEEAHLTRVFGQRYEDYLARVPRWIGRRATATADRPAPRR